MAEIDVTTLYVRDVVSKTFHITPGKITMHDDIFGDIVEVPQKYWPTIRKMVESSREAADEYTRIEDINVHSERGKNGEDTSGTIGLPAQKIWEELIQKRKGAETA